MRMEIELDQSFQIINWEEHPFSQMDGIEVLDHAIIGGKGERKEPPLEKIYRKIRRKIKPGEIVSIGATGLSGASKGSLLMGFYRLLSNDEYLHQSLGESGAILDLHTLQYVLELKAAKTDFVKERYPVLWIPPVYRPGTYPPEMYVKANKLGWRDIEQEVLKKHNSHKATVILYESASLSSFPENREVPVQTTGEVDRGNSILFNLAFHPKTRENCFIFAMVREDEVKEKVIDWRNKILGSGENLRNIFSGEVRVVFTDKQGVKTDVYSLPEEVQREVAIFLREAMMPPRGIERADANFLSLAERLKNSGKIAEATQSKVYRYLWETLGIAFGQFLILRNPPFQGHKTYDLDYLFQSIPARKYPGVISPTLLSYIRSPLPSAEAFLENPYQSSSLNIPYIHPQP